MADNRNNVVQTSIPFQSLVVLAVFRWAETLIKENAAGRQTKICSYGQVTLTAVQKSEITLDQLVRSGTAIENRPATVTGSSVLLHQKREPVEAPGTLRTNPRFLAGVSHPGYT